MKRHFILGIMAVAALASCNKSEVLNQESLAEKGISFSAYTGKAAQTKAATIDGTTAGQAGIGILAWRGTTDGTQFMNVDEQTLSSYAPVFMNNILLKPNDKGKWAYTNERYWPSTGAKVSFFAYSPYAGTETIDNTTYNPKNITVSTGAGAHIIEFKVPNNTTGTEYKNQTDLMVAEVNEFNQNLNKDYEGDVKLKMKHALSKITLQAIAGSQNTPYSGGKVKVVFKNINLNGKFTDVAKYNLLTGEWSDHSAAHELYAFVNADSTGNDPFTAIADEVYNNDAVYKDPSTGLYYLNDPKYDLMVIPSTDEADGKAIITSVSGIYQVITYDANDQIIDDYTDNVDFNITQNLTLEAGKHYIFKFNIELKKISFSVEIEDWDTEDDDRYIVNTNTTITQSYTVNNQEEWLNMLPEWYTDRYKDAEGNYNVDLRTLPWMAIEFTPTPANQLKITVQAPGENGQIWENLFAESLANKGAEVMHFVTIEAGELPGYAGTTFEDGVWKVTINKSKCEIQIGGQTGGGTGTDVE